MKISTIIGARPQFIKAATISREVSLQNDIEEVIIHTGQHFDSNMSDVFFEELKIPLPNYNLGIGGGTHGQNTGRMIEAIEAILIKEQPDWVLVYGDTDSTLAGAIAAKKLMLKLAHVEAGLRSHNMRMPEEQNRILTDRISDVLFCPTQTAVDNLYKEGFASFQTKIINCGDVMYDAALFYKDFAIKADVARTPANFILCTIHRAENTDSPERLRNIIDGLTDIAKDIQIILPLHPRTKKVINTLGFDLANSNITVIDPVGYLEMIGLIHGCNMVITDSGGLQKEAFFFEKPCITMRDETEWIELVETGSNMLTGADSVKITEAYQHFKDKSIKYLPFYGDGKASQQILKSLKGYKSDNSN